MVQKKACILLTLLILVSSIGGLLLQGCGAQEATETPIEEPEPTETMEEDGEPTEEAPVPIPSWCDGGSDLKVILVDLSGEASAEDSAEEETAEDIVEGIQVEVCLPGGAGTYTVDTHDLDQGLKNQALDYTDEFPIAVLMGYFEVYSIDPVQQVFEFDPPLLIRIIYADGTWEEALENEVAGARGYPRVAYLVMKAGAWSGDWVEFSEGVIYPIAPGTEGFPEGTGALIITIENFPDPLIGGC